jgi:anti-anti-sigma factor
MARKLFTTQLKGSTLVVIPTGSMMGLEEHKLATELERIYGKMQQPDVANLVIDFEHVPYFGSVMLGAIVSLSRRLQAGGGNLAICNISTTAIEVLQITRLDTRWPIYASQQEACASFDRHD